MVKLFSKLFGVAHPSGSIAVRPSRTLEVPVAYDIAFERCKSAVQNLLGAAVREEDRPRGYLESSPGLMFSERICFTLEPIAPHATRVTVESRRIAGAQLPPPSTHIAAVAEYILRP